MIRYVSFTTPLLNALNDDGCYVNCLLEVSKELCIFPTTCIYIFRILLGINNCYFHEQY